MYSKIEERGIRPAGEIQSGGRLFGAGWTGPVKLSGERKVWYRFLWGFLTAIAKV